MVPKTLNEWTYESISALCARGQSESDRHDFKFSLPAVHNATKICCAFANTFGGFVVLGVKDSQPGRFEIVGLDPDKELYGNFVAKVKAEPDIAISFPKTVSIPGSQKLLYVFEIPQSPRRPHLPSPVDQRVFWKRQGSDCVQMTLEEIRYQMSTYEEKREKLALLLIDLQHKLRSVTNQAAMGYAQYNGDTFSFDTIDRVVAESFSILKADVNTIGALDTLKSRFMLLNIEKEKMLYVQARDYSLAVKTAKISEFQQTARNVLADVTILVEQIERSLEEKFEVINPYKV